LVYKKQINSKNRRPGKTCIAIRKNEIVVVYTETETDEYRQGYTINL